ncbi:hypothetical protein Oweho_3255 [Owenweeksia hongkongensis DSM 17368]|uniref:Cthe-2314-like HEPN domain-containing protein n=1 Tax=Owenweeksia hongkongensis (strain DSM 17368 / CIP 108786 / JCM 12287 / NRRL B-23963 / UST20020801) TaxID=926562 RepID=G8R4A6_OWEHD|nr:hypothetical protein [Owenweeksia hongkongensis]AEV34206.1 hypothetical protein Oweho_3255 [Owenweeksia hongkongensis DSM 17368]
MNSKWEEFVEGRLVYKEKIEASPDLIERYIEEHQKQLDLLFELHELADEWVEIRDPDDMSVFLLDRLRLVAYFCFLTSSFLDHMTCVRGLIKSQDNWQKVFYAGKAALVMYETFVSYNDYQKHFSQLINEGYPDLSDRYKDVGHLIRSFKKHRKYDQELKIIRHCVSGHYHKQFNQYYRMVRDMNIEDFELSLYLSMGILKIKMNLIYDIMNLDEDGG